MDHGFLFVAGPILGILLIFGGIIAASFLLERKRRDALRLIGAELRLDYFPHSGPLDHPQLAHFVLMGRGHSRRLFNLLVGASQGVNIAIFDYRYTIGTGKNRSIVTTTAAHVQHAGLGLPLFNLQPEGFFDKIAAALGGQDLDLPDHPEFSKRFRLQASDEERARALFTGNLATALEKHSTLGIEGVGDELLIYRAGRTIAPKDLRNFITQVFATYAAFSDARQQKFPAGF